MGILYEIDNTHIIEKYFLAYNKSNICINSYYVIVSEQFSPETAV